MTVPSALVAAIEERTGLAFRGHQRSRMLGAMTRESHRLGCADEQAYAALVANDEGVLGQLVDRLVIGETYFFRDSAQVALVRELLDHHVAATSGPVQVWSAGCASGEEAYTLAMLGKDAGLRERMRVLGTDASPAALQRARRGSYSPWSLRAIDEPVVRRWFHTKGRTITVRSDVAALVRFRDHNLLDGPPGTFDLVLCRNVLMYLTADAVRRVAHVLAASLRPGGYLVTGASDPHLDENCLVRTRTPRGMVYRAAEPERFEATGPPPRACAVRSRSQAVAAPPSGGPPAVAAPTGGAGDPGPADVRALVADRRFDEARESMPAALAGEPLAADLRCLAATLHLEGADPSAAAREARAALYLDPSSGVAHVLLAHALQALGQPEAAVREYRRAADVLTDPNLSTPDHVMPDLLALVRQVTTEPVAHG